MSQPEDPKGQSQGEKTNPAEKFKFKEMKVYSSDEWLVGGTKKYRRVFDRFETTYMRVELSFFNKLFDEADWNATIRTKCYFHNGSQKNELSNHVENKTISKDENIIYIRHSWGNDKAGSYWRKGNYIWEGYIDEVKVGEALFYVEDLGETPEGNNLFFDIESLRMFEGNGQASSLTQKKYLKQFSAKESQYVWGEFQFRNKAASDYYAEIFFHFMDEEGRMIGHQSRLLYVQPNTAGQVYTAWAGWGSETKGSWNEGSNTLEILFMDQLIASLPFEVRDQPVEGDNLPVTEPSALKNPGTQVNPSDANASLDSILQDALDELNAMTGLDKIKIEVNEMVQLVKFYQETGKDVLNKFSLHTVFTGNPGTGKTSVARILSRIYKGLGILAKGHLVEVDREGLVAGYVGQTAIKTNEKINEAMGGILFIDEAYSLAQEKGSMYDFGGESIQIILKRMEDHRGKFGVIVAGYTNNMYQFIKSNPGLKSRFDKYFHFEDYTPDEMFIIALSMFRKEDVLPDVDAATHLKSYFKFLFDHRDEHFGNARTVRQVVAESVKNQNLRLATIPKENRTPDLLNTVTLDDVREFELKLHDMSKPRIGFK